MKRCIVLFGAFLILTTTASAQIGKSVSVAAGTPEDKDLEAIYAAPDGPDKIALLDKFMADHGTGDLALLGDQLYAQTYLAQKNYAKVYEYGDKVLALDPDDFSALILMMHAADEQGDAQKIYALGEKVGPLLARYQASPAPAGMGEDQWSAQKAQNLKDAQARSSIMCNTRWLMQLIRPKICRRVSNCWSDTPKPFRIRSTRWPFANKLRSRTSRRRTLRR